MLKQRVCAPDINKLLSSSPQFNHSDASFSASLSYTLHKIIIMAGLYSIA